MILKADDAHGIIKLGETELTGVFQGLLVNGEILIDSNNSAGNDTPRKVMRGFKDKTVSVNLLILPQEDKTVYEALEELERLFYDASSGVPKVYALINSHTAARNISKIIFQGLSSFETNRNNTLEVSLTFEEFKAAGYSV